MDPEVEALVKSHMDIPYSVSKIVYYAPDPELILSYAMEYLCIAAEKWVATPEDERVTHTFRGYAWRRVTWDARDKRRKIAGHRSRFKQPIHISLDEIAIKNHTLGRDSRPLDLDPMFNTCHATSNPDHADNVASLLNCEALQDKLTDREKELLAARWHGDTLMEVATRWGVTESRVCQINTKLRKKMEAHFGVH